VFGLAALHELELEKPGEHGHQLVFGVVVSQAVKDEAFVRHAFQQGLDRLDGPVNVFADDLQGLHAWRQGGGELGFVRCKEFFDERGELGALVNWNGSVKAHERIDESVVHKLTHDLLLLESCGFPALEDAVALP